ncbi:ClpX C4-type zinc finger protein [Streptacidiphilus sp. N1-3]|uniref:ClpX C4-type zinc finger protein n=1 Tax=Streptacidiphilus alkalitolerans TaxID=3342712 RepID=A0ABV6XCU2_9ACTN
MAPQEHLTAPEDGAEDGTEVSGSTQLPPLELAMLELDLLEARSRALMHALRTRRGDHHWVLWKTDLRAAWRAWDRRLFSLPLDQAPDPAAAAVTAPNPAAIDAAPATGTPPVAAKADGSTAAYCQWCGGKPDHHKIVVSGPGVTICNDCIDLVTVIVQESKEKRQQATPAP